MGSDIYPNVCDTPSVGGQNGPHFWVDLSEDLADFGEARLESSLAVAMKVLLLL